MRILHVLDSYPPDLNGGAYFTHRLARQLKEMGHDILVVCPSRSYTTHFCSYGGVDLFRVRSVPILIYRNFRICIPIGIRRSIVDAIEQFRPDVIHLQGRFILGDICMRIGQQKNIPMLATNHFMPENFFHYTGLPLALSRHFSRLAWRWVKDMFDRAAIWSTPTESSAALMKRNGFDREIHAISCGIDLQKFAPRRNAIDLPHLALDKTRPVILYTGRLDKEKNIPVVIDAFRQLRSRMPCYLLITGDGAERRNIERLVAERGLTDSVKFTGYLPDDDYPAIYSLADCFVHAGTAELQSIVTLEAVASGLPVVAANAMALPELVHHGVNGYLFEPGDSAAAGDRLHDIVTNPALMRAMSQESLKLAKEHDLAVTGARYTELYESLSPSC